MKSITALTLAGFVLLGASNARAQSQHCHYATPDTIANLFNHWNKALVAKDMTALLATYADSSILLPTLSDTVRITREEKRRYFKHFLAKTPSGHIDSKFIVLGCNSAVAAGIYTFTFTTPSGKAQARYTYTYKWTGREWLITSHHSSKMPGEHSA